MFRLSLLLDKLTGRQCTLGASVRQGGVGHLRRVRATEWDNPPGYAAASNPPLDFARDNPQSAITTVPLKVE
jgi:hypothetical protein